MRQHAWVVEANGDEAVVELRRHSACAACGACWGADQPRRFIVSNPLGIEAGNYVAIEMPSGGFLWAAFVVYIIPLIAGGLSVAVTAAVVGHTLSDGVLCLVFIAGVALTFLCLHILDRMNYFSTRYRPEIVGVCGTGCKTNETATS